MKPARLRPVKAPREKSEDIDLVAGHVVVGEESIAVADILTDAAPGRPAQEPIDGTTGADPLVVERDLLGPVLGGVANGPHDLDDIGGVAFVVRPVPSTVEANDQSFHDAPSPTMPPRHLPARP